MESDPARYFDRARGLYTSIRFPALPAMLTAADLVERLAEANPSLPRAAIRIRADRAGWLQEIWLCLDRRLRSARCARQQGGGVASNKTIRIPR